MSDQPQYPKYPGPEQPPVGGQVPPPPGYQPPPAPGQGAPAAYPPVGPMAGYASWWSRVGASVIDGLISVAIAAVPAIIGLVILGKTATTTTTDGYTTVEGAHPAGFLFLGLAYAAAIAFGIWNTVFRQGRQGQTLGKKALGIQVVRDGTGEFLGAGKAFLRMLVAAIVGSVCFLNYLWPLWDARKQTWHDKIVGSVVIPK